MINNLVPENAAPPQERLKAPRITHRPDITRQKMGEYFIVPKVEEFMKKRNIIEDFLDGRDLEEIHQGKDPNYKIKRKRNLFGKKSVVVGPEDIRREEATKDEIEFVGLVGRYHDKVTAEIEKNGELIEDHQDRYLDPLSIGIAYKIAKNIGIRSLRHTLNFPEIIQSEQFKTTKTTVLLTLADASLDRFENNSGDTTEIDIFAKYIKSKAKPSDELPRSNSEWRNLFIVYLENNPQEFLQDYFINYRFSEPDLIDVGDSLARNTFKLGEIITGEVIENNRQSRSKDPGIRSFLPYEDIERNFPDNKQSWRQKIIEETKKPDVKKQIDEALHFKLLEKKDGEIDNRSKIALINRGVLEEDSEGLSAKGEFIEIFADYFEKDVDKPEHNQNQMVLGMLYSMRHELGVGVLPQAEILKKAKEIIPSLRRLGNDILITHISQNFDEFSQELAEYAQNGLLGEKIKKEFSNLLGSDWQNQIEGPLQQKKGESDLDFFKRRQDRLLFKDLFFRHLPQVNVNLVNLRVVDGFGFGERVGEIVKTTAEKKFIKDKFAQTRLESKLSEENAVMKMLIEGEQIEDPKVRERVEATMKKTSRLWKFIQRSATKAKIAFQNKLFYTEGESPFMAKPSIKSEAKTAGAALALTSAYGHFVNNFMEDPVNRGVEAGIFMGGYFIFKEGGGYIKEFYQKRKEQNIKPYGWRKPKAYIIGSKEWRAYMKEISNYKKQVKPIHQELRKKFWHNKGKFLISSGSYIVTSLGLNVLLQQMGISGAEAPYVLAATNVALSGALSAVGVRSGAEFIVNSLASKKAVDGGMELLTGNKQEKKPPEPKQEFHFKNKKIDTVFQVIRNKAGIAFATNIAPRIEKTRTKIEKTVKKIKFVGEIMTRHEEENKHLQLLERFVNGKDNPKAKFTKDELVEVTEFLTLMKEEEGMLLIHNPRFYSKRMIRQQDGSFIEIDNRQGLKNIDITRLDILKYAQTNLPREEYLEVYERSLDFFADVNTIREKVFNKRLKYLVASYGYRVGFMVLSHVLTQEGGLLEGPANLIFGNAHMDHQQVIGANPNEIFKVDITTNQGKEDLAKEVWARTDRLNNLAAMVDSPQELTTYQSAVQENNLAYWGVNQAQIEGLVNQLKVHNLNTADLMRFVYVLSGYKEGQEYLSSIPGFDGTEHKNLAPLVEYLSKEDPYDFMVKAANDKRIGEGVKVFLSLKYPDLAEKLELSHESLEDQVKSLVIPNSHHPRGYSAVDHLLSEDPIVITKLGPQIIKIGDIASEFVDGLPKEQRQSNLDFLIQMQGVLKSNSPMLDKAVEFHFASFLADSNNFVDISKHLDLNVNAIDNLSAESMIYKIFHAINPTTDVEITKVVDLINKAKSGDVAAYSALSQMVAAKDAANIDKVFESQINSDLYDRILNNLPGDNQLNKEEITRRIQQEMIDTLSLRPVSAPIINMEELADLRQNPDIFTDPRQALGLTLNGKMDLEMAVNISGKPDQIFVQNDTLVAEVRTTFQINGEYTADDLKMLNAVEGSESDDDRWTFPRIIAKNVLYLLGQKETASGATPPAGSLVEMMTGDIGRDNALNPEAPSVLHAYDKYGPGYLSKLVIAHFRGRIPEDLAEQMGPNPDLTQKLNDKDPSIIDRLCFKFESLIAGKELTARWGEDEVHTVYLNHANLGTINGVEIKGVEAASVVLFDRSFKDLNSGEKFLIIALGQSPNEYMFDYQYDADGNVVGQTANPLKAVEHAIYIIENGKIGNKLDKFLPGQRDVILKQLKIMEEQAHAGLTDEEAHKEGWKRVFAGGVQLPEGAENYVASPDAATFAGMTPEQIKEALKSGVIKSATMTPEGKLLIILNEVISPETTKLIPEGLMTPEILSGQDALHAHLVTQYSALTTDLTLSGDFYKTQSGIEIPAWHVGTEVSVPGMAIVEIGPDGAASIVDPTNTLSAGPQLFGSAFKPLVVFSVMKLHPELNLGEQQFNAHPAYYQGQWIENSANLVDNQGTLDLRHALAASANVPMVDMWTKLKEIDPNIWYEFKTLAKDQFGIHFYELKDGGYIEVMDDPFVGNAALPVGNIFVGGATPEASGMMQMAEFYQKLGEMSVTGDPAASYVTDALGNDKYKADVDIWGPQLRKYFDGVIAKTGSQQGFDPVTGEPMAIRNIVAMVKIGPDGKVVTTLVVTGGIKPDGNPVELEWGSEFLPVARNIVDSAGAKTSLDLLNSTQFALNQLFTNPEGIQNYQLGAISVDQLYPFIKGLSSEEQYAALRETIRFGQTKYLFVDLVNVPVDGVQAIAIHYTDKNGVDKLLTLNVSANIIEPVGPVIGHFANNSSQTAIYEILNDAVKSEPEKFGGLLNQLQSQGVNFVPIHDYEASPALFALHEQMEKNGMLFTGAEDAGAVMKQLGLDPKTTVFVNDELFRALQENNPNIIKEQLFIQREYLTLASIYESSGAPGSLDTLLYSNNSTSNPAYQLLKIFVETKTSQTFEPVNKERLFLIGQFKRLIAGPNARSLAPDVIRAYELYNEMSSLQARGEAPNGIQSKEFVDAMKNFLNTTDEKTLRKLGIIIQANVPNSTPVPQGVIDSAASDVSADSLRLAGTEILTAPQLVESFIDHSENFAMLPGDREKAKLVSEAAMAVFNIVNSPETLAIPDNEQKIDFIVEQLAAKGFDVERRLISTLVYDKQCVYGYLVLNNILANEGIPGFVDMEGHGGATAKSFAAPLIELLINYRRDHPNTPFAGLSTIYDHLFMQAVDEIPDIKIGDTLIISAPWVGENSTGHIAQVLFTGSRDGVPYMIVFDTNADNNGTTAIREITDLRQFISQENWDTQQSYPGAEPIYIVVRPEGQ